MLIDRSILIGPKLAENVVLLGSVFVQKINFWSSVCVPKTLPLGREKKLVKQLRWQMFQR